MQLTCMSDLEVEEHTRMSIWAEAIRDENRKDECDEETAPTLGGIYHRNCVYRAKLTLCQGKSSKRDTILRVREEKERARLRSGTRL